MSVPVNQLAKQGMAVSQDEVSDDKKDTSQLVNATADTSGSNLTSDRNAS